MTRQCGGCTLCCKLLPVRSLGKKDGQKCKHQSFAKGCGVYANLMRVAPECVLWTCRWLTNDDTDDLSRPDRSRYVIDVMPDFIKASDDNSGEVHEVPVVQVWVDPKYPDAHKDPALRAWLDRNRHVALIRYSAFEGFVLFPPSRMANREWMEKGSINDGDTAHSAAEVLRVLANQEGRTDERETTRDAAAPVRGRDRIGAAADEGGVEDPPAVQLREVLDEADVR